MSTGRPLTVLLHFIAALDGRPFEHVDPNQVFVAMKRELPDLRPEELNAAADAAKELSRQLRRIAWRVGAKPGKHDVAADQPVVN
jgi:hypothetical protein